MPSASDSEDDGKRRTATQHVYREQHGRPKPCCRAKPAFLCVDCAYIDKPVLPLETGSRPLVALCHQCNSELHAGKQSPHIVVDLSKKEERE